MERTRERIARAAFELHALVGPARTTISAVADRAGVQRHTVYNHFPDLVSLIRACSEHGIRTTGVPDPEAWRRLDRPEQRLRRGLRDLYRYYRANAGLLGNIFRDIAVMPELAEGSAAFAVRFDAIESVLREPWTSGGGSDPVVEAAISHAIDFGTWRSLTARGLSRDQAVEAMLTFVRAVAEERGKSSVSGWASGSAAEPIS